ncbi:hypothetical protein COOONC_14574 [Cooperia oncophora]
MQLLDGITFPYDDATRRHLLTVYRQKQSFLDGEIVQEHLLSQPLLCAVLIVFAIISLGTFLFSVIFVACRALGNCGAKRYQGCHHTPRQSCENLQYGALVAYTPYSKFEEIVLAHDKSIKEEIK